MITILYWMLMSFITELSKKFKVSQNFVLVVLCLVGGSIYYAIDYKNPAVIEQATAFVIWAYATSQAVYSAINKFKK